MTELMPKATRILALMLLLCATPAIAQWRIERVLDGDSIRLIDIQGQRLSVRLEGIDAPEKSQPYADRSRQNLQSLMTGCKPEVSVHKTDRYGRSVSQVFCDERDVALAQLEDGFAWHFGRYAKEQSPESRESYRAAEQRARQARRGLWKDDAPLEPWAFRDQQRALRRPNRS